MRFCDQCGAPIEDGANFCTQCNAPVYNGSWDNEKTQPGEKTQAMMGQGFWEEERGTEYIPGGYGGDYGPGSYITGQGGPEGKGPKNNSPKKKIGLIIACVVCALAIIGTGITVGALYFSAKEDSETAKEDGNTTEKTVESKAAEETETAESTEETSETREAEPEAEATETPEPTPTETPEPTPTETPTAVRVLNVGTTPDLSSYVRVGIAGANATSQNLNNSVSNDPSFAFDDLPNTSWQEGVGGYGVGEILRASFDGNYKVHYIAFRLGNWKSDRYFWVNPRPKTLTVKIGDFVGDVTFPDGQNMFYLEFNKDLPANAVEIVIKDVYTDSGRYGDRYQDTPISDILFYGVRDSSSQSSNESQEEGGQIGQAGEPAW